MMTAAPQPDPRENLLGFLMRCADREGMKSVRSLLTAAGIDFEFSRDTELVRLHDMAEPLARYLGMRADDLRRIGYAPIEPGDDRRAAVSGFGGQLLPRKSIDLAHLRVCPACLEEVRMSKAVWEIPVICACPKHGCRLIERCHKCDGWLRAVRWAPHVCRCGAALRKAPRVDADPLAIKMCLRLHASLRRDADGAPVTRRREPFDFPELSRLIWALHLMHTPKGGAHAPELFHRRSPVETEGILVQAARMLDDWPESLHRICRDAEPVRWTGRMLPPSIESGRPYQIIVGLPAGAAKEFLRAAWTSRPEGVGRRLPPGPELVQRRRRDGLQLLTRGEARQVLGVSDKGIDNLERSGRLIRRPATERSHAIWSIDEVAALAERKVVVRDRSPSIARDVGMRLASIVGIDLRGAQRMIQKCRIPPFDLETMIGDKAARSVDALDGWLRDVLSRMPQVAGGDLVSLDALVLAHGRFRGLDRGTALALLVSGLLVPVARKGEQDPVCDLLFPHQLAEPGEMASLIESGGVRRVKQCGMEERR